MSCLTRFGSGSLGARLLCLPHAGASGDVYAPWARELQGAVEVWGVTPPGRRHRCAEPLNDDPQVLIDEIVAATAVLDDRPLLVFGHSMGALIGYEVALALEAAGRGPSLVVASGSPAPHIRSERVLREYSDAELAQTLVDWGGTAAEVLDDPQLQQLAFPPLRADLRLCDNYNRGEPVPLTAPLSVMCGRRDQVAPPAHTRPWRHYSTDFLGFTMVDGGHFFVGTHRSLVIEHVLTHALRILSRR